METLREELAFNGKTGIKTSVVFMTVLKSGLADGFGDSYKFKDDVVLTNEEASKIITNGILRNKTVINVPFINFFLSILKFILPSNIVRLVAKMKIEINQKYLILNKNKFD
jgi:short-subunit dehydrogenase